MSDKVTLLVTDEWVGYRGLAAEYPHEVIRHTHEQYVVGSIHTQTIEGFLEPVEARDCRHLPKGF